MSQKTLIKGTSCEIRQGRTLIGGTGYDIFKGRALAEGAGYDISFVKQLEREPIGSSVFMNVDGVRTEFIVVHQGNPDPDRYDDTCNGTWLLMKDIYSIELAANQWNYLSNTLLPLFDDNVKSYIRQANIPTYDRVTQTAENLKGVRPYSRACKLFLLSPCEIGWAEIDWDQFDKYFYQVGNVLSYFSDLDHSKRIAYYKGYEKSWWMRSIACGVSSTDCYAFVSSDAGVAYDAGSISYGFRPALIMNGEIEISPSGDIVL